LKKLMSLTKETVLYYKNGFLIAMVVYFLSILVGIFIFHNSKIPINPKALSFLELLSHNSLSVLLVIIAGIISFGLLGNFVLIANGIVLGRILIGVFNNYGISPILTNIAPHFFFETSALLMATALSYETYKLYYNIRHTEIKVIRLKYFLTGFCFIILLLVVAALIESYLGR